MTLQEPLNVPCFINSLAGICCITVSLKVKGDTCQLAKRYSFFMKSVKIFSSWVTLPRKRHNFLSPRFSSNFQIYLQVTSKFSKISDKDITIVWWNKLHFLSPNTLHESTAILAIHRPQWNYPRLQSPPLPLAGSAFGNLWHRKWRNIETIFQTLRPDNCLIDTKYRESWFSHAVNGGFGKGWIFLNSGYVNWVEFL